MHISTISVGKPQTVEMGGKQVYTAFMKEHVSGPVVVTTEGVEGDKPAVHPDAIYVFPKEHYNYWTSELGVPEESWAHGFFGENLTTTGISEENLYIGDILKIGSSLRVMVVSPRIPCAKLAWRVGQPMDFLRRFSLTGKTGFYLKVLEGGSIQAGDRIEILKSCRETMSVAELSSFICRQGEATEEELHHVLSWDSLGMTAQEMLRRRLVTLEEVASLKRGRWKGWRRFNVAEIRQESEDVRSFVLKPTDPAEIAGYRAGQFLTCALPVDNGSLIRTWSLSDYDTAGSSYRVSIKRVEGGLASNFMHDKIQVGSTLSIKPPAGSFVLDRAGMMPTTLISGGIGITPMLSMLKAHARRLQKDPHCPPVYFFHCAKNGRHSPFSEEVRQEIARCERFRAFICFTDPDPSDQQGRDYDALGRLTIEHIKEQTQGCCVYFGGKWQPIPASEGNFYICGPEGMHASLREVLEEWGAHPARIFTEAFQATHGEAVGKKVEEAEIVFSKSGRTLHWSADDDMTILELAEANGIEIPNSCRMGVCQTCECALETGSSYYAMKPTAPLSEQTMLTCCARPGSSRVVIEA